MYVITDSQIENVSAPRLMLLVTDNAITPTLTDCNVSTGPIFSGESVQTLFFD